jgi:hypothetical protein
LVQKISDTFWLLRKKVREMSGVEGGKMEIHPEIENKF